MAIKQTPLEKRNERLAGAMYNQKHSQRELAQKLGIHRTTLSEKMKGNTSWTVAEIELLAKIYGKPRAYFF
jgi:transcriptional regulator with XRE-family HTH domain